MSDSNRTRVTMIREVTLGVTPASPQMKELTLTNVSLNSSQVYTDSERLRSDRQMDDPTKVNVTNGGSISDEFSSPPPGSAVSDLWESALFNTWGARAARANDGVADAVITAVDSATDTFTVTAGAAFAANMLVYAAGFAQAANNGLHKAVAGSNATSLVVSSALVDEVVVPGTASLVAVGVEAGSGDIAAVADGITSTVLDFTTLGLSVGSFFKLGGTGAAFRFATEANNTFVRVVSIAANKITLDNLPSGWAADTGTGKTLRIFLPETLRNGTTMLSQSIERGYMGQTPPTYIAQAGMVVSGADLSLTANEKVTTQFTFMGMTASVGTVSLDGTPTAAPHMPVMAAPNVCRIAENGQPFGSNGTFIRSLNARLNNNLEAVDAIRPDCGSVGPVTIRSGSIEIMLSGEMIFGSGGLSFIQKANDSIPTNINVRLHRDNLATVISYPRVIVKVADPAASSKNQTQMLPFEASAVRDPATGVTIIMDRFNHYQA